MKKFLIFLCAFVIAAADDEPAVDCENWPSNLKKVEECCNIPFHSNSLIQNICYSKCVIKAKDLQDDCTAECYVNMTGLIKEGTINKVAVKRIYENNCFSDRRWAKTISDAVDKCEYDSSESVMKNLVKFYNCADDFLAANCVSFIQSVECDATEDHFEQCKKIEPNCTAWPIDLMHPDVCCKIPKLISDDLTTKCRFGCQRKEFFSHKQVECMQNCTYIDTGLKLNGKFDFEVVKKILMESTNKTEAWEKPIGEAAEVCEKLLKGKKELSVSFRLR